MNHRGERAWIVERAGATPDAEAMRFGEAALRWRDLAGAAEAAAARLDALGVRRGDIVAVRMPPSPHVVAQLHAAQMLGAALLPLNLRLAAPEIARILDHAGPKLLVDDGASGPAPAGDTPVVHPDDLHGHAAKSFVAPPRIDPDAALAIVCTSGTSAAPKAVVLSNANFEASAAASRRRLGHGPGDAWLATLPLFHVGGLAILARSVLEGSRVLLEPGFDLDRTLAVLPTGEATMVSLVPTMLGRVLDRLAGPVSPRLRCALVGGAALAPALGRRALEAGLPVSATYGMTECGSQVASSVPGSDDAARGFVGLPLDGTEILIGDADGEGVGEILVRGPSVMRGYWRNPVATREAFDGEWLRTGDLGRLDERGALAVTGRRDDLIVTGGENVSPLEVEHALDAHPSVKESLVRGEDDAEWGQRIVALVVARDGVPPDPASLEAWSRQGLAGYKVPREFRVVTELPRNATGKLLRRRA